eukprot:6194843-Pleurochrysis_carterae.AAC.1
MVGASMLARAHDTIHKCIVCAAASLRRAGILMRRDYKAVKSMLSKHPQHLPSSLRRTNDRNNLTRDPLRTWQAKLTCTLAGMA